MATRSRRAAAATAEAAGEEDAAPEPASQRPETAVDKDLKADLKATVACDGKADREDGGGLSKRQVARVLLAANVLSFMAFIGCIARASPINTAHDCCEQWPDVVLRRTEDFPQPSFRFPNPFLYADGATRCWIHACVGLR